MEIIKFFTKHTAIRFVISGGTAAVTHLSVLFLLNGIYGIHYLISTTFGFLCAFGVSFTLHKFWTFKSHEERTEKQAVMYLGTSLFGLFLNNVLMYVFVGYFHIQVLISQIFVGLMVACSSFFISRNFVFKYNPTPITNKNE